MSNIISNIVQVQLSPPLLNKIYLGWDIGIKNLAFCLLESPTSNTESSVQIGLNYYNILDWGVINLVSQVNELMKKDGSITNIHTDNIICCRQIKINKKCLNKALFIDYNKFSDGSYRGYCKKHVNKLETTNQLLHITNKKCVAEDCVTKSKVCLKNHHYIIYCGRHKNEMIKNGKYNDNDFLTIQTTKKSSSINLTQLGRAIMIELDKRPHLCRANIVLLENQPVLKNPTMKSIQMFLYSYFIIRGMIIENPTIDNVQCYMASNKIEIKKLLPIIIRKQLDAHIEHIKNKYIKNKETAIFLANYYISKNLKWGSIWISSKKQDDLADSLLMTIHYLEKTNLKKIK